MCRECQRLRTVHAQALHDWIEAGTGDPGSVREIAVLAADKRVFEALCAVREHVRANEATHGAH